MSNIDAKTADGFGAALPYSAVSEIPRRCKLSRAEFEAEYLSKGRPVILAGNTRGWRACREWTPRGFASRFGSVMLHASLEIPAGMDADFKYWGRETRWMRVDEFVEFMMSSPRPCYMRQAPSSRLPGLADYFDFGDLVDMTGREPDAAIWFGSGGTNSGLHWDTAMNFLAQIHGRKRVMMFAPEDCQYLYPYPDQLRWSRFDGFNPDFEAFPKAKAARPLVGTLHPGDTLHVPMTWWHQLVSLDVSISINCFFKPECRTGYFFEVARSAGMSHLGALARDFVSLGLLEREYRDRVISDVPTGLYLYNLFAGALRRRLGGNR